jgi:chemotaxis protein MotB
MPEPFLSPAAPSRPRHFRLLAALRAAPPWVPWLVAVLVTGAALYGVVWGYGVRGRLLEQAEKAEAAAGAAAAARRSVERELAPLKADKAGIASEKVSLAAARASLTRELALQAGQQAALKAAANRLRETMKREISQGDVHLAESKGRLEVSLADRILFERGSVSLSARGEGVLARVGAALGGTEGWQIQVSGHTDNTPVASNLRPRYPSNWELSLVHSARVVRFLQERAVTSPDRLVASGHGEYQPVASNQLAADRAKNRRVELLVVPAPPSGERATAEHQPTAREPPSR